MLSSERFQAFHKNLSIQTIYHLWYETKVASFTKELKLNFLLFGQANLMIFACIDIQGFHKNSLWFISLLLFGQLRKWNAQEFFYFPNKVFYNCFTCPPHPNQRRFTSLSFYLQFLWSVWSVMNCLEFCILCSSFEHPLNKLTILIFWFCQFRSLCWEAFPSLSLRI